MISMFCEQKYMCFLIQRQIQHFYKEGVLSQSILLPTRYYIWFTKEGLVQTPWIRR